MSKSKTKTIGRLPLMFANYFREISQSISSVI